jgi:hypothetical protein
MPSNEDSRRLIKRIDAFIAAFERSGEAPDCWQYLCTIDALDCLSRGNATVAARDMAFAETPPELRPPIEVAKMPKVIAGVTAAELRLRFDDAVTSLAQSG